MAKRNMLVELLDLWKSPKPTFSKNEFKFNKIVKSLRKKASVSVTPVKGGYKFTIECQFPRQFQKDSNSFNEVKKSLKHPNVRFMILRHLKNNKVKICLIHSRKEKDFNKALKNLHENIKSFTKYSLLIIDDYYKASDYYYLLQNLNHENH